MNLVGASAPKVLLLTTDMSRYRGAYYQNDFLLEFQRQAECFLYGPGIPGYVHGASIEAVLGLFNFEPDLVFAAHAFLNDNPGLPLENLPGISLHRSPIPVYGFLNKEYSRLEEKLAYFANARMKAVFTHHHDLVGLAETLDVPTFFEPFAVDPLRFRYREVPKKYDFGFTGLLRNPTFPDLQSGIRTEIMNELFFVWNDIPVVVRPEFSRLTIQWRSWTGRVLPDVFAKFLGRGRLSEEGYANALAGTRIWLNAPSPLDLVSTRYFECMASGSVVIAQHSSALERLFPEGLLGTFRDVEDFREVLGRLLDDSVGLNRMASLAHRFVLEHHTWKRRVTGILDKIEQTS